MSESNQSYGGADSKRPAPEKKPYNSTPVVTRKEDEDDRDEQHYTRLRS